MDGINYTDIAFEVLLPPAYLDANSNPIVKFQCGQRSWEVTPTGVDLATGLLTFTMPQEISKRFYSTTAVQVNWFLDGGRMATAKKFINIGDNLIERVLTNA